MSSLKGLPQLEKRIAAVAKAGDGLGRSWAGETVRQMQTRIPRRTGYTASHIRVGETSDNGARVTGTPVVFDIDSGTREHDVRPKFGKALRWTAPAGGRPIFRPSAKIPRMRARPFRQAAADAALQKTLAPDLLIRAWNDAA